MRKIRFAVRATIGLALLGPGALAATFDSTSVSGLGVRNIGSATMSGRIAAVAGRQEKDGKVTFFVGAASGGVWKSSDGATSFKPVFDREPVQSIGAIALDPTNDKTVWVGTGEGWTRNSTSIGDGIYKSTDGGETWTNMGLRESERITKIVVNPKNGNVVYACVPGKLWSDSPDRGLYKTSDGGKTWRLVLKGPNLSTGCSGVTLSPANPDEILAGLWDFRRKGWTFRSGGDGPTAKSGSGLYHSTDGGKTWSELTAQTSKGLPAQPWGRIEVVYAPSKPSRVYAVIENVRSALFVSDDGGKTWEERDRSARMVWRPFYFSRLVVDPKNADRVFKMNLFMIVSDDAGKSFSPAAGASHGDWHDIWINPANPQQIIGGDDGGLWLSYDGGSKWWKGNTLPISQFYRVSVDDKDPFQVYGGLQDNACFVGDSSYPGGITNDRWENFCGGDGFWMYSDPADPNFLYAETQGGFIIRADRRTYAWRDIQPKAGYKEKLRFNWNTPIALSPNEKGTIYIGSQFLFRSRDHGVTWDRISPDLTTNNPEMQKQEESGGITVDNSAAEMHTTIFSISESPKSAGLIWVGTDDGNVQVTRNGGRSWTNVTANIGVSKDNWTNAVEASRFDAGTAYAAFDRHTFGDMGPYVYRTRDYGKTWQALITPQTAGVRGYVHVVKEDPKSPNILYVGTEFGLFISIDAGTSWTQFRPNNFPSVAVRDLAFQERDDAIAVATHGRGIWIIDDISPLRTLSASVLDSEVSLIASPPVQQRIQGNGGWVNGDAAYVGENPPNGAVITYYQKARHVIGRLKIEVLNTKGDVVATLPALKRKGLNRVIWSMRDDPPQVPPAAQLAFNSAQGPRIPPGSYTVRLTKAGKTYTMPLSIVLDRRAGYSVADRVAQYDAAKRVSGLFGRMSRLVGGIQQVRAMASGIAAKLPAEDALKGDLTKLSGDADALRKEIVATKEGGAITGEERLREQMDYAYGAIMSVEERPTKYQLERVDALERELKEVEDSFAALRKSQIDALNPKLKARGLPEIVVQAIPGGSSGGGGRAKDIAEHMVGLTLYNYAAQAARAERD